jgi:hypothetical protein
MDLYNHSLIRPHSIVLNYLSTRSNVPYILISFADLCRDLPVKVDWAFLAGGYKMDRHVIEESN